MSTPKLPRVIGLRGARARVFRSVLPSRAVVRVQWSEHGRRHTKSWPWSSENIRVALLTAEGIVRRLQRAGVETAERLTIGELFDRYVVAKEAGWREKSRVGAVQRWRSFTVIVPATTYADLVTEDLLDEFRRALKGKRAPNQVLHIIGLVKRVWKFAAKRRWIPTNPIADYENALAKDEAPKDVPEFTPAEVAKLVAAFDLRKPREWRMWVAVQLATLLGPRERSLFGLEWRDIDFAARTVHWRPELDKRARERWQPLPIDAVFALRVARIWCARIGYTGRFVFPAAERGGAIRNGRQARTGDRAYTYQAAIAQLHRASREVGVEVIKHRGFHGFRRHAAANVLRLTGSIKAAGDWIGDTDMRTLTRSYLKKRPEEQREVARALRSPTKKEAGATEEQSVSPATAPILSNS